jgi:SAM-dependent methyltransferase
MSEFPLLPWLALREPLDAASRSTALTRAAVDALPRDRRLRIVDLGCGTGSNVRYLQRFLPGAHEWLLVDKDPSVLAHAPGDTRQLDLGARDAPEIFAGRDLVTASALLDLVSAEFLTWLAGQCRVNGAVGLFTLTYSGRSTSTPAEPEDDEMCVLLNRHQQQSDKGFGPMAGPEAVACAERAFAAAGYRLRREPSDWRIAPEARELQRLLIEGWADAAREMTPLDVARVDDWLARRLAHVAAGRSRIVVSHEDLLAVPHG